MQFKKIFTMLAITSVFAALQAAEKLSDCKIVIGNQRTSEWAIMDFNKDWRTPEAKLWSFNPKLDPIMQQPCVNDPENRKCDDLWLAPSDVKAVLNKTHLLCVDSLGGVLLVRIKDKKIIWHVYPRSNPHSAELLPDGNVVTASSEGHYLKLFNIRKFDPKQPGATPFSQYLLQGAHGVVWDKKRQCLWSSGDFGVTKWRYISDAENPRLEYVDTYGIIKKDTIFRDAYTVIYGHDLFPTHDGKLFLTYNRGISIFDPETCKITHYSDLKAVKSLDSFNGKIMMLKPQERWWAENPHFPDDPASEKRCFIPNAKIYKARFFQNNNFSY